MGLELKSLTSISNVGGQATRAYNQAFGVKSWKEVRFGGKNYSLDSFLGTRLGDRAQPDDDVTRRKEGGEKETESSQDKDPWLQNNGDLQQVFIPFLEVSFKIRCSQVKDEKRRAGVGRYVVTEKLVGNKNASNKPEILVSPFENGRVYCTAMCRGSCFKVGVTTTSSCFGMFVDNRDHDSIFRSWGQSITTPRCLQT